MGIEYPERHVILYYPFLFVPTQKGVKDFFATQIYEQQEDIALCVFVNFKTTYLKGMQMTKSFVKIL